MSMWPVTYSYNPYAAAYSSPAYGYGAYGSYTPYATANVWPVAPQTQWLPNMPAYRPIPASRVAAPTLKPVPWTNQLQQMFHNRQAVVYALHLRTFAAKDKNGDGKIEPMLGENGTFLKAIKLLPELKAMGVNTIHLLPILPVGKLERLGEFGAPGSVYAPAAYDKVNPEYDEPANGMGVIQEARMFVDACHRLGIHVMVDVPSCASVDLANARPDLLARDLKGNPLTPTNWIDIRMFVADSPALREYYGRFFDLMVNKLNVDGFRCDIARARTMDFWRYFINKYPDKAWLAETYTEEDSSPMVNLPRDIPEDLLKAGFDSIYGQFHIFHDMDANQYIRYLQQIEAMLRRVGPQKSAIGSFLTHDDPSTMDQGGPLYGMLISGLMATQPHTNPYILDGFSTGFAKHFDIFNWRQRPQGQHPEIGEFLKRMLALRKNPIYSPVLTVGKFIPLRIEQSKQDPRVIAFLRQYGNRTLLVVANKDMNATRRAIIEIPGLNPRQKLVNLAPQYGEPSTFVVNDGQIQATLARGRFYLFELALHQL